MSEDEDKRPDERPQDSAEAVTLAALQVQPKEGQWAKINWDAIARDALTLAGNIGDTEAERVLSELSNPAAQEALGTFLEAFFAASNGPFADAYAAHYGRPTTDAIRREAVDVLPHLLFRADSGPWLSAAMTRAGVAVLLDSTPEQWRELLAAADAAGALPPPGAAVTEAPPKPKRGRPRRGPAIVPQQTWPEFEAVIFGVAVDGRTATQDKGDGALWRDVAGEVALTHSRRGSELSLKLGGDELDAGPLDELAPLHATSCDELRAHLERVAGPRAGHVFNYCVARGREEPAGFTVEIDELVNASGPRTHGKAELERRRAEVWDALRVLFRVAVYGRRKAYRAKKGETDILETRGVLVAPLERGDDPQLSFDADRPPREITLVAGPWLARLAEENPRALPYWGDDRANAQLPAGRGVQAWRDGIAWALGHLWRAGASGAREVAQGVDAEGNPKPPKLQTRDFTRRELLDYLQPEPPYSKVLAGAHPLRAVEYWDGAITLLRQQGVIGKDRGDYVEHGPAPWRKPPKGWPEGKAYKPQGWQDAWLEQRLTIRPGPAGQDALRAIRAKADEARAKAARTRAKNRQAKADSAASDGAN